MVSHSISGCVTLWHMTRGHGKQSRAIRLVLNWWDRRAARLERDWRDNAGFAAFVTVVVNALTSAGTDGWPVRVRLGVHVAVTAPVIVGAVVWYNRRARQWVADALVGTWDRLRGRGSISTRRAHRRIMRSNTAAMLVHIANTGRHRHHLRALACVISWADAIDPVKVKTDGTKTTTLPRPVSVYRVEGQGATVKIHCRFPVGKNPLLPWRNVQHDLAMPAKVEHGAVDVKAGQQAAEIVLQVRLGAEFGAFEWDPVDNASHRGGLVLAVDSGGRPVILDDPRTHSLFAGMSGSGKTTLLRAVLDQTVRWSDTVVVLFDPHGDLGGFKRWTRGGYVGPRDVREGKAKKILIAITALAQRRFEILGDDEDGEDLPFGPDFPLVILIWDELARFMRSGDDAQWYRNWFADALEQYRKVGIHVFSAAQHPTDQEMPFVAKMQIQLTVALRLRDSIAGRVAMGNDAATYDPTKLPGMGHAWIQLPNDPEWIRARCVEGPRKPTPPKVPLVQPIVPFELTDGFDQISVPEALALERNAATQPGVSRAITKPGTERNESWAPPTVDPSRPVNALGTGSPWGPPTFPAPAQERPQAGPVAVVDRPSLPRVDADLLDFLAGRGGHFTGTGAQLAEAIGSHPSAVSKSVPRLVEAGLVSVVDVPGKGRRRRFTLL